MADRRGLFAELKRRNVWRAAVLYAGAAWALSQGVAQLGPAFGMPEWGTRWFVIACIIGFPFWLAFAWFYELTPHGFKREDEVAPDATVRRANARRLDVGIIAVLVVAVALLASGYFIRREPPAPAIPAKSIAVLPFQNLSDDPRNEYFVSGMQDLILTRLAGIGDLKVISRTSTMKYQSRPENLRRVADELGVATILEGSVQKQGNQVLINVQLINAQTDAHLWAESYRRTLDDIFGVEGEVAAKIAEALHAELSPEQAARLAVAPTTNERALDLFLRAEYLGAKGDLNFDVASWKAALPLYRDAVAEDPEFALAWARLSYFENALAWFGSDGLDVRELSRRTGADAERALALQPNLAVAHLAMGFHKYLDLHDNAGARTAFATALRLKPNYADAMAAQAYLDRREGNFDAALAALRNAVALDPRNSLMISEVGATSMMLGRYDDAQVAFRRALAVDPDNLHARLLDSNAILLGTGDMRGAWAAVQGDAPVLKLARVKLLTLQRRYGDALQLLEGVPDLPATLQPGRNVSKAALQADLYRLLGQADRARPLFEQELAAARARLDVQQGINLGFVWRQLAQAELGLGHVPEGLDAIAKALAIVKSSGDHFYGPLIEYACAALYAQAARPDLATPLLAKSLAAPGSRILRGPILLWLAPVWDPIRKDAAFQALLRQHAPYQPGVTSAGTTAVASVKTRRPKPGSESTFPESRL